MPLELTIVVPTMNERDNVGPLVGKLHAALGGVDWEVIFVDDDSIDGTSEVLLELAQHDRRVRCLRRIGRRGLAGACIEGILASTAPIVAVMDADLQHDEGLLWPMLDAIRNGHADAVVGSRYASGGSTGDWHPSRRRLSGLATWLAHQLVRTEISDPMSGFFMLRRGVFDAAVRNLSGVGFKILLDILASSPEPVRVAELPYTFRTRVAGESKLDSAAAWEFLLLLLDKTVGRFVPIRFMLFSVVGVIGLAVHLLTLGLAHEGLGASFEVAQSIATLVAMTNNFFINNILTYRDVRLRGRRLLLGLMSFYLICALGAVANVGVASVVYGSDRPWWFAGIAGALVGAVWNYAVSSVFTWGKARRPARTAAEPVSPASEAVPTGDVTLEAGNRA